MDIRTLCIHAGDDPANSTGSVRYQFIKQLHSPTPLWEKALDMTTPGYKIQPGPIWKKR